MTNNYFTKRPIYTEQHSKEFRRGKAPALFECLENCINSMLNGRCKSQKEVDNLRFLAAAMWTRLFTYITDLQYYDLPVNYSFIEGSDISDCIIYNSIGPIKINYIALDQADVTGKEYDGSRIRISVSESNLRESDIHLHQLQHNPAWVAMASVNEAVSIKLDWSRILAKLDNKILNLIASSNIPYKDSNLIGAAMQYRYLLSERCSHVLPKIVNGKLHFFTNNGFDVIKPILMSDIRNLTDKAEGYLHDAITTELF